VAIITGAPAVGEMRSGGVRGVLVYCTNYQCSHVAAIRADECRLRSGWRIGFSNARRGLDHKINASYRQRALTHLSCLVPDDCFYRYQTGSPLLAAMFYRASR
jgi:hypothetical protein